MNRWFKRSVWIAGALGLAVSARADLRVVGTDLLGLDFTKAFYEFSGRNGIRLALALDGSRSGLGELEAGRADVALVMLPPEEAGTLAAFQTRPLAYRRVVVLVPAACPLERITLDQLAAIFGATENPSSKVVRWGELGVTGEWGGAVIAPLAPAVGSGVEVEYFGRAVLQGRPMKTTVGRFATVAELTAQLVEASRALAIAPAPPEGATHIKMLPVVAGAGQPAVLATSEALHTGSYPLGLAVQVVFRTEKTAALARLLEFLWSEAATRELERAGVSPLPAAARAGELQAMHLKEKPPK